MKRRCKSISSDKRTDTNMYKLKVTYTNEHDELLSAQYNSDPSGSNWDKYYHSIKHPAYFKEFDTKEELACFILDLTDRLGEEVIIEPLNSEVFGSEGQDYREIEVYNDYRE